MSIRIRPEPRPRVGRSLWRGLAVMGLLAHAPAQVPLTGALSDATTGPLVSGTVYHVNGSSWIPQNATLTIPAGVVLKFRSSFDLTVFGSLRCTGTGPDQIWFTHLYDDAVGGDSNGDGNATVPMWNTWGGIVFQTSATASSIRGATVRYAGQTLTAGFELMTGAPMVFEDCGVLDVFSDGWDLRGSRNVTMTNCRAIRCIGAPVSRAGLQTVPNITGLVATDVGNDWVVVGHAILAAGETIRFGPQNSHNGVFDFVYGLDLAAGSHLTIDPGTVIKSGSSGWSIAGTLVAEGTAASPIWITDDRDDAVAGDSNGDGAASSPVPGGWGGLYFLSTAAASRLEHVRLRYSGRIRAPLEFSGCDARIRNVSVFQSAGRAVSLNSNSRPHIDGLDVDGVSGPPLALVPLQALARINGLTTSNTAKRWIELGISTLAAGESVVIGPENGIAGVLNVRGDLTVGVGADLTLLPGTVLKVAQGRRISVAGSLFVPATRQDPVYVTSEPDDSVGGDSNGPHGVLLPGQWRSLSLAATAGASVVSGLELRYGGAQSAQCEVLAAASLTDVTSRHSGTDGFVLEGVAGPVERLVAWRNNGAGVQLRGGPFDLRQVSSVENRGAGVSFSAGWGGTVSDTIVRDNAGGTYVGLVPGAVRYSNGDPLLAGQDGNIDVDPQFVDQAIGDLRLSPMSLCIDAGDPNSPLDPDATRADMGGIPSDACQPRIFCPQPPSASCVTTLTVSGFASLSGASPLVLRVEQAPRQSFGLLFYGLAPSVNSPGPYGVLCAGGFLTRTMPVPSGVGDPQDPCSGLFESDFGAWIASGVDPAIVVGSRIVAQFWYREAAAPSGATFSDAVELRVCP